MSAFGSHLLDQILYFPFAVLDLSIITEMLHIVSGKAVHWEGWAEGLLRCIFNVCFSSLTNQMRISNWKRSAINVLPLS